MIWYVIVAFRMFLECVCICLTHPWLITFILYSNMCLVLYFVYESCMNDINARNSLQVEIQVRDNCRHSL